MPDGEICIANPGLVCEDTRNSFACSLPATSESQAADFLETISSGGVLGTGFELKRLGVNMPALRAEYESQIQGLVRGVNERRNAGRSAQEIAQWIVAERRRIANRMRWRSGAGTQVLFEVRDWTHYGMGGRTFVNLERRYMKRGLRGARLNDAIIEGATKSNAGISATAVQGARYLKQGGRVIVVFSLAGTAYTLLTAPPHDLERLLYEELGGFAGGVVGAEAGVGACLVFGIATGGWGLLACGLVGGIGGGVLGNYAGNRLYYSNNKQVELPVQATGILDSSDLAWSIPPQMCIAP